MNMLICKELYMIINIDKMLVSKAVNHWVGGSSPSRGAKHTKGFKEIRFKEHWCRKNFPFQYIIIYTTVIKLRPFSATQRGVSVVENQNFY
jgi:hypothetical protein